MGQKVGEQSGGLMVSPRIVSNRTVALCHTVYTVYCNSSKYTQFTVTVHSVRTVLFTDQVNIYDIIRVTAHKLWNIFLKCFSLSRTD